jgi:hypothetical protein
MLSLSVRKEGVHARVIDRLYREKRLLLAMEKMMVLVLAWHGMAAMPSFRSGLCFTVDRKHTDGSAFSPFCFLQIDIWKDGLRYLVECFSSDI